MINNWNFSSRIILTAKEILVICMTRHFYHDMQLLYRDRIVILAKQIIRLFNYYHEMNRNPQHLPVGRQGGRGKLYQSPMNPAKGGTKWQKTIILCT